MAILTDLLTTMWSAQSEAEGLTLLVADNTAGFFGVHLKSTCRSKPYQALVRRSGPTVYLGHFVTAEEAALCVARSLEGQAAAAKAAAAAPPTPPLTSEQARQQAQAEGLTLRVSNNKAGYFGVVCLDRPGLSKPYQARLRRGGKDVRLGSFVTREEAALCVARSPEAQVAAKEAAAAPPLTGDDDGGDDTSEEGEEEFEVLDAVEVGSNDGDDEEAEEVTIVVERKRAREGKRPWRSGASR